MSDILVVLGLLIGLIAGISLGLFLSINHITKIIGTIIGAAHCYLVFFSSVEMDAGFISGLLTTFTVFDLFAACFAIYEVFCFIAFVGELLGFAVSIGSKPSPSSHAMGGLASWISSFFR